MPFDQSRIIEQAKFTYSPLGKALEKQTKMVEKQGKNKQMLLWIKNKRLEALTNKDVDQKDKEICNGLVKERLDKMIELADEINENDLVIAFNGIKLFEKTWWNKTRS